MNQIDKLKQRLVDIVKERDDIEKQLQDIIIKAIEDASMESPYKSSDDSRIVVMKYSDFANKPMSPSFFNWRKSINTILDYLKKKSAGFWKDMLEEKLKGEKDGVVMFKKIHKAWPYNFTEKTPVDARFIQTIINKLDAEEETG